MALGRSITERTKLPVPEPERGESAAFRRSGRIVRATYKRIERTGTMARSDFAVGLLVGGALGAAFALLYAPTSGEELRSTVKEKATDLGGAVKEKAVDLGGAVKDKAGEYGSTIRDKAVDLGGAVRDRVSSLKHGAQEAAADLNEAIQDA